MALHLPKTAFLTGIRLSSTLGGAGAQRTLSNWKKNNPASTSSSTADSSSTRNIHLTTTKEYPQVAPLPLPDNVDPNETIQFSPQRDRDINCHQISLSYATGIVDVTCDSSADPHLGSYDSSSLVNLSCMMQSNVPEPFGGGHKFTHLNMPGGQWAQNGKFMAQDLQASHYTNLRQQVRSDWDKKGAFFSGRRPFSLTHPQEPTKRSFHSLVHANTNPKAKMVDMMSGRVAAMSSSSSGKDDPQEATKKQQQEETKAGGQSKKMMLKQAFKDYGSTVIVFHVGISLASLGMFYALVSSGLDVVAIMEYLNLGDSVLASKAGTGASTFVVAYAVHKIFAPVRISITLGATPFLVRMMRKRGILKGSK